MVVVGFFTDREVVVDVRSGGERSVDERIVDDGGGGGGGE